MLLLRSHLHDCGMGDRRAASWRRSLATRSWAAIRRPQRAALPGRDDQRAAIIIPSARSMESEVVKPRALDFLVCPQCHEALTLEVRAALGAEILEGTLACTVCHRRYPIVHGVPRFVASGAYASSFGRQWNWFRTVNLDSKNGTRQSEDSLTAVTGWSEPDYAGRLVLDAGVGTGRFAEVVAKKGGEVVGVDLTVAVDAAYQ